VRHRRARRCSHQIAFVYGRVVLLQMELGFPDSGVSITLKPGGFYESRTQDACRSGQFAILKRYLVKRAPISDVCGEYGLQPSEVYYWQAQLFEHGATASSGASPEGQRRDGQGLQDRTVRSVGRSFRLRDRAKRARHGAEAYASGMLDVRGAHLGSAGASETARGGGKVRTAGARNSLGLRLCLPRLPKIRGRGNRSGVGR